MLDRPTTPARGKRKDAARIRYARYRMRRDRGEAVAMVSYGAAEIDFLIATRWLRECDAGDRRKVGDAIGRMLAASARAR